MMVKFFDKIGAFLDFFISNNFRGYVLVYKRLIVKYLDNAYAIWIFSNILGDILIVKYRKEGDRQLWIVAIV